jgi:hypothetical protein
MFDEMLRSPHSPRRIWQMARDRWGLRTPKSKRIGGKPLALSAVYRILKHPFYAGILIWHGNTYQGAHEPVITVEEYKRVQDLLHRKRQPRPQKYKFPFTGLIHCGSCGLTVTAEHKINAYGSRYVYYHCTKRDPEYRCTQPSITDKELERQIIEFLGSLVISDRLQNWVMSQVRRSGQSKKDLAELGKRSLAKAIKDAERSLGNLTSLRIRDLIGDDEFIKEKKQLEQDRLRLDQELQRGEYIDNTFELWEEMISFSNKAMASFKAADLDTKRLIVETVGSNFSLKDKILSVEAKKPFQALPKKGTIPELRAAIENIRTLYAKRDAELLGIVDKIKEIEARLGLKRSDPRHQQAA